MHLLTKSGPFVGWVLMTSAILENGFCGQNDANALLTAYTLEYGWINPQFAFYPRVQISPKEERSQSSSSSVHFLIRLPLQFFDSLHLPFTRFQRLN